MILTKQPHVAEFAHKIKVSEEAVKVETDFLKNQLQEFQNKIPLFEYEVNAAEK
jgi:hypothetical protein